MKNPITQYKRSMIIDTKKKHKKYIDKNVFRTHSSIQDRSKYVSDLSINSTTKSQQCKNSK